MSRLLPLALAGSLLIVGCGPVADETPPAGPIAAEDGEVSIIGTDRLRWNTALVTAEPGPLTIELVCEEAVNHNLVIDREVVAECAPGGTDRGTIELESGQYEFLCTVPGHQRTMRGTIRVG